MVSDDIDLNADDGGGGPRREAPSAGGVVDDVEGSGGEVDGGNEEEGRGGAGREGMIGVGGSSKGGVGGSSKGVVAGEVVASVGASGGRLGGWEGGEVGVRTGGEMLVAAVERGSDDGRRDLRALELEVVDGGDNVVVLRSSDDMLGVDVVDVLQGNEDAAGMNPDDGRDVTEVLRVSVDASTTEECKVPVTAASFEDDQESLRNMDYLDASVTFEAGLSASQTKEFIGKGTPPGDRNHPVAEPVVSESKVSALKHSCTEQIDVRVDASLVRECKVPVTVNPSEDDHASFREIGHPGSFGTCETKPSGSLSMELVGVNTFPSGRDTPAVGHEVSESEGSAPRDSASCEKVRSLNTDCGVEISVTRHGVLNDGTKEATIENLTRTDAEVMELSENVEGVSINHGTGDLGTSFPENVDYAHYFIPEKKDGFSIYDLVWGKIKSHPWWPGQIIDPSNASEMALKHQRKDNFLVAYFGDKTFAWCDEFQLRPFQTFFSQMEKQSNSEVFLNAVNDAMEEVSRRVELAMLCPCVPENLYSEQKYQIMENAGIRKGVSISVSDRSLGLLSFQPSEFLRYISSLAKFPTGSTDKMALSVTQAQLMSFYHSKGCVRLHVFFHGQGIEEDQDDGFSFEGNKHGNNTIELGAVPMRVDKIPSAVTSCRGRPKSKCVMFHKQRIISEDGRKQKSLSQLMEDGNDAHLMDEDEGSPTNQVAYKPAVHRGDMEVKHSSPSLNKSFKLGDCIRRVATKLIGSSSVPECDDESNQKGTMLKIGLENDNPFSLDISPPSQEEIQIVKSILLDDSSSLSRMLSQLCTAAVNPFEKYDFVSTIVTFFTEIHKVCASITLQGLNSPSKVVRKRGRPRLHPSSAENVNLTENIRRKRGRPKSIPESCRADNRNIPEKTGRKRGRPRKVPIYNCIDNNKPSESIDYNKDKEKTSFLSALPEIPIRGGTNRMKDTYWTDMVIHGNPEKKRRGRKRKEESLSQNLTTKSKPIAESSRKLPQSAVPDITQHMHPSIISCTKSLAFSSSRQIKYFGKKGTEASSPTALILSFSHPDSVPSRTDLMRIFSCYGPLKEAEVSVKTKCATLIFKKQADAESAFSGAGKCSVFGPSLVSYRLKRASENTSEAISADEKKSSSIVGSSCEISGSKNVEPVPNLHLEVAGVVSDEKSTENSNTNALNQKSTSMEICTVEDNLSNGGNLRLLNRCAVEVQGNEKDLSRVDNMHLEIFEARPDEAPVDNCDIVGSCDSIQESADRGDHNDVAVHRELSVSGASWEITDVRFMESCPIDVLSRNTSKPMEICNVENPVNENDIQPLIVGNLKTCEEGKPDEMPTDDVCFNVLSSINDSEPMDAENLDIQVENGDEKPSGQVDFEVPDTNLNATHMHIVVSGDSKDSEVKGSHHMVAEDKRQLSSDILENAGIVVAEGSLDSGNIEVDSRNTLMPMNLVTEKNTLQPDAGNLNALESKNLASSNDYFLDEDACRMKVQDGNVGNQNSRVLNIKQDEMLVGSDNLFGFESSERPSGVDVCGMVIESESFTSPPGSQVFDRPTDSDNVKVPTKNDLKLSGSCTTDIPVGEEDKSSLGANNLKVPDCKSCEAAVARIYVGASNTTKDSASKGTCGVEVFGHGSDNTSHMASVSIICLEAPKTPKDSANEGICNVEAHGHKRDNAPGGSVLEVQVMEEDQIMNSGGDVVGNLQKDLGNNRCIRDHQIGNDASNAIEKDVDLMGSCKAGISIVEKEELPLEHENLRDIDFTSRESIINRNFLETSATTNDPVCGAVCAVKFHGHNGDSSSGGSVREVQCMEQNQVIDASSDIVGNLQKDPGSDCLARDHRIVGGVSPQSISGTSNLGLKNRETCTSDSNTVALHAKGRMDVGITQPSDSGNEISPPYGHQFSTITAITDGDPITSGNSEVSGNRVDETPMEDLLSKTFCTSVDAKSKEITERYKTTACDGHDEA